MSFKIGIGKTATVCVGSFLFLLSVTGLTSARGQESLTANKQGDVTMPPAGQKVEPPSAARKGVRPPSLHLTVLPEAGIVPVVAPPPDPLAPLPFAATRFDFGLVSPLLTEQVSHTFALRNDAHAPVLIERLQTSGGSVEAVLTDGRALPLPLAVGEQVSVRVSVRAADLLPNDEPPLPVQLTESNQAGSTLLAQPSGKASPLKPGALHQQKDVSGDGMRRRSVWLFAKGQDAPLAALDVFGRPAPDFALSATTLNFHKVAAGKNKSLPLTLTLSPLLTKGGFTPQFSASLASLQVAPVFAPGVATGKQGAAGLPLVPKTVQAMETTSVVTASSSPIIVGSVLAGGRPERQGPQPDAGGRETFLVTLAAPARLGPVRGTLWLTLASGAEQGGATSGLAQADAPPGAMFAIPITGEIVAGAAAPQSMRPAQKKKTSVHQVTLPILKRPASSVTAHSPQR